MCRLLVTCGCNSAQLGVNMKSNFAVFLVLSLLLVADLSCARKDLGGYWKEMMKEQPMPEAIKDLVGDSQVSEAGKDRFIRGFNVKPNVILYHTHVVSMKQKQKQKQKLKN